MKLLDYQGCRVVIFIRDEHCPPHVTAVGNGWRARFLFSFWDNGVALWDVFPKQRPPGARFLEDLRALISRPVHLRSARTIWSTCLDDLCLRNQMWDGGALKVVAPKDSVLGALTIMTATFEVSHYMTRLYLSDSSIVEIVL